VLFYTDGKTLLWLFCYVQKTIGLGHSTSPDFLIFRQKRDVIVKIVLKKTGKAMRQPVLGSIPR